MVLAAKCAPQKEVLERIYKAKIEYVELYLNKHILGDDNLDKVISLCKEFPLFYSLHAPSDDYCPKKLYFLSKNIGCKVIVFHDIFWEKEWEEIYNIFYDSDTKICIENTHSVHQPVKFMRRFSFGRCLDVEHFQMECGGFFEEEFVNLIKDTTHIHLTGYTFGKESWHTHIDYSTQNYHILNLIRDSGYRGWIVSEARTKYQNLEDFIRVRDFFLRWQEKGGERYV